ncbi:hypothetical protein GCM10009836_36460 [Pseudonocardia ailaonensis]|uniref:Uncharacterized protein n=1 Tax=Pseudonocardia ailaonensis TaxID=367279 RepID=A0ABN2N521_9PSEU
MIVGCGPDGGEQRGLRDRDREIEVSFLGTEVAGKSAPSTHRGHFGAGGGQQPAVGFPAHDGVMVAMGLSEDGGAAQIGVSHPGLLLSSSARVSVDTGTASALCVSWRSVAASPRNTTAHEGLEDDDRDPGGPRIAPGRRHSCRGPDGLCRVARC